MKKGLLALSLIILLFTVGCTPVEQGNYKEGTYFGSAVDEESVATTVIYVDKTGVIKSVFIDTTYEKDEVLTTKKTLGNDYGMKNTSANVGKIPGGAEWDTQINNLEKKIIEEQGLEWLTWSNDEKSKTDAVSGVTITIDLIIKSVESALNQAK